MTDDHIRAHAAVWTNAWIDAGGSGLSANLLAKLLGVRPWRVAKILLKDTRCPWYCGDTEHIMWDASSSRAHGATCTHYHGYAPGGLPVDHDDIIRMLKRECRLGPGSLMEGHLSQPIPSEIRRELGIRRIPRKELSNEKCVHCHKGKVAGFPGFEECPCGCGFRRICYFD
jgi:hypothetical protein